MGVVRYWRRGADGGVRLVAALSVLILLLFATSRSMEAVWLRLTSAGQEALVSRGFRGTGGSDAEDRRDGDGRRQALRIRAGSPGTRSANPPFYLSYHWLEADADRVVSFEGLRTPFDTPVSPSTTVSVRAEVRAPSLPGDYRLAWDVVQEGQLVVQHGAWSDAGVFARHRERAVDRARRSSGRRRGCRVPPSGPDGSSCGVLAAKMLAAHPILGVGADNFRLLYGPYAGLTNADPRIHSNNMYLEMLVGGGLIGGLAFLWLVWRAAALFRRRRAL